MKFAIAIPQFFADGEFDPASFREYFARAEELGFESAWTQESTLGFGPQLSPIETMTYAAACTERMRLGCVVFVSTLHSPVHLAKSLSTLDQLSRGRIEVGVGTGGRGRPFAAFGVDPARYVARFTEGVNLMKALWTEPRVTFQGEFWQLENAPMEPKPFQKPYPRLWFGGASEPALRRAVRMGDGFFGAGSSSTDKFAEQVQIVRRAVAEARPEAPAGQESRRALWRGIAIGIVVGLFITVAVGGNPDEQLHRRVLVMGAIAVTIAVTYAVGAARAWRRLANQRDARRPVL